MRDPYSDGNVLGLDVNILEWNSAIVWQDVTTGETG